MSKQELSDKIVDAIMRVSPQKQAECMRIIQNTSEKKSVEDLKRLVGILGLDVDVEKEMRKDE